MQAFSEELLCLKEVWSRASSKVQKGQTTVKFFPVLDFAVENIPVKLQHDACNYWWVIAFKKVRQQSWPWWAVKLVQKSKKVA